MGLRFLRRHTLALPAVPDDEGHIDHHARLGDGYLACRLRGLDLGHGFKLTRLGRINPGHHVDAAQG